MSKFVVVVFPDETNAYEGLRSLQELHQETNATVYGTAVVQRGASGGLDVVQPTDQGPLAFGVRTLVNALRQAEVSGWDLSDLSRQLRPGDIALLAEVSEEWTDLLDRRMAQLGGRVMRVQHEDTTAELLRKRADATRAELAEWRAERAEVKVNAMDRKMTKRIDEAQRKLEATAETARLRLEETRLELDAKLKALEEQSAKAEPETRSHLERRIAQLRKDFTERAERLTRAFDLAQRALHPS
jgi:uncharacterized membrane protein